MSVQNRRKGTKQVTAKSRFESLFELCAINYNNTYPILIPDQLHHKGHHKIKWLRNKGETIRKRKKEKRAAKPKDGRECDAKSVKI